MFFNQESCDCVKRYPLILIGTTSNYYSKEKAICTRIDYLNRKDSTYKLDNLKFQLRNDSDYEDSVNQEIKNIDSLLMDLKKDWTHLKIKTKWKGSDDSTDAIIIKQKIKYYNNFRAFRKYMGFELYKNGKLKRTKLNKGYSTK